MDSCTRSRKEGKLDALGRMKAAACSYAWPNPINTLPQCLFLLLKYARMPSEKEELWLRADFVLRSSPSPQRADGVHDGRDVTRGLTLES